MIVYEVMGRKRMIDFYLAEITDEVLQNVAMILTTPRGTVPLRRDWFIDLHLLDTPLPVAQARIATQIFQAIRRYEPRARITGPIKFIQSNDESLGGRIIPAVSIEVVL